MTDVIRVAETVSVAHGLRRFALFALISVIRFVTVEIPVFAVNALCYRPFAFHAYRRRSFGLLKFFSSELFGSFAVDARKTVLEPAKQRVFLC